MLVMEPKSAAWAFRPLFLLAVLHMPAKVEATPLLVPR